jgi:hypothetical protein
MNGIEKVGFVLMVGGGGAGTPVERVLREARQTAARDLIEQAQSLVDIEPIIVLTDEREWVAGLEGDSLAIEMTPPDGPFHFGQALARLTQRYGLKRCLYMGGGSAPLLPTATLSQVVEAVLADAPLLVTNNLHSSDWAALSPVEALYPLVPWLERDNALAWVWREKGRHPVRTLPRAANTQLDIDTPFDLLALARHPGTHPRLREFLRDLDWPRAHLDAAVEVLRREASQVIIAGRVSAWVWQILESRTRTWTRVYAEERGMRASGRQAHGEVRSLLSDYLDLVGVDQFFVRLAEMADAILLDSRVILASRGLWPSDADRFHADLLMADQVREPFLRAFTAAARRAPVPVVMGGHSLVAGGLVALLEGADSRG